MKRSSILFFGFLFCAFGSATAQRIKGSDTLLPLSQKMAEEYMKAHPGERITVTGGGSGVGIASLQEGTTDIAQASRAMKPEEIEKIRSTNRIPVEKVIAYDGLAVVVNPSNPVGRLTREQLQDIFTGKITNWDQVGGKNLKIIVYTRETSSGTYDFFKQHVMRRRDYTNKALSMPATGSIVQSIAQTPGAIGFVGLPYIGKLKPIAVSYDGGKHYYEPTFANASSGKYPIVRPLYYYYNKKDAAKVTPFIDYILSPTGDEITRKLGYVPVE
ncbi:MAG: phosphate ABC transporter substrate-binding protein [Bacteroidales bacterium]